MGFLGSLEEYLESNQLFSLERNFDFNLTCFQRNNKRQEKSYTDFLADGLIERADNFYNKFCFLNECLGRCEDEEKFIEIIDACFNLLKYEENSVLHNYLFHVISITDDEILHKNIKYFEKNFMDFLYDKNYIDICSINSLMFTYLVLLHNLKIGGNLNIFQQFITSYKLWSSKFWSDTKLERKKNYGILIYQIQKFHNARDAYLDLEIYTVYDAIAEAYKNVGDVIHSEIFCDLSNELKDSLISSQQLHRTKQFKLLNNDDHHKIKNVFYRINSYRKPITIEILYDFIFQFDSIQNIRAMIKLLENLNFFTFNQLSEISENILIDQINLEANDIYICPLEANGSSFIYQYLTSHSDNLDTKYGAKLKFERSIEDVLKKSNIEDEIVIIDDCSLSGTQTSNILKELLGIREIKPHHEIHCDKIESNLLEKFRISKVNLCFCVGSSYAENVLRTLIDEQRLSNFKVYIGKYLHMTTPTDPNPGNRIFGCNSLIWDSVKQRDDLKEFCRKKGSEVLRDIAEEKGWNQEKLHLSALGYSDLQQVVVFPYSVPKTTLSILWCENENWKPLFPNT
ncbi:hypothetical protein QR674_01550 [Acinetobacter chinensis]|uniref:PRTase-CE domain-containing protein n=1 Tax=Acinetobacter chinensis TaxID=2004650 RepID=A0ABU3WB83_9GAMM|nr:hypothetical protein [Acinetobacter chinensis]MDV2467669.1 hypothetical protein [Acinetobacter chinensis]